MTYQTASWLAWVATLLKPTLLALKSLTNFYPVVLGPVVQKVNSANHWINHYPADKSLERFLLDCRLGLVLVLVLVLLRPLVG